jgi:hypothetical protein
LSPDRKRNDSTRTDAAAATIILQAMVARICLICGFRSMYESDGTVVSFDELVTYMDLCVCLYIYIEIDIER